MTTAEVQTKKKRKKHKKNQKMPELDEITYEWKCVEEESMFYSLYFIIFLYFLKKTGHTPYIFKHNYENPNLHQMPSLSLQSY